MEQSPLLTDLYELTMLAGYLEEGMAEKPAVFDLYFRTHPFEGAYAVFAGLEPALEFLEQICFSEDDLRYLSGLGLFKPDFIDYLRTFRFRGTVTAPPEGSLVFAHEPLLTVEGTLAEAQFVETALLNSINFQTLVATKSARICHAAAGAEVMEFGLRRAQGPDGSLSASRAATVGGCRGTSNVLAGKRYGLPVRGTQAHSWIQAFPDELTAFRAYADSFPDNTILLVDTYDILQSGLPHAITVGRELRARGHELCGIRIDSGDLAQYSREARRMLDNAGLHRVKIVLSNDLDECSIAALRAQGGLADIYGIGTSLVTGGGAGGSALGGVYKLVELEGQPKLKITGDRAKATLPGKKQVLRLLDSGGNYIGDIICLEGESVQPGDTVYDLNASPSAVATLPEYALTAGLRSVVMSGGKRSAPAESLSVMARRCRDGLERLPTGCLQLTAPERYQVSLSRQLHHLRCELNDMLGNERG